MNPYSQKMQELDAQIVRQSQGVQPISLTEEEITASENLLGHRLPEDYRLFLRDFGCYRVDAYYRCESFYSGWSQISLFYGITPADSHPFPFDVTLDLLHRYATCKPWLPTEFITIGDTNGNIVTCLALSGDNRGAIYHWDRMEFWDSLDYEGIYYAYPSFDEFINSLLTEEQYETEDAPRGSPARAREFLVFVPKCRAASSRGSNGA